MGELVQPLVNLLEDTLGEQSYLHMGETTVQVLEQPGQAPESPSFMHVLAGSGTRERPVILFDYDPSRSRSVPKRLLEDFRAILQVDGYAGYEAAIGQYGLLAAGCDEEGRQGALAHAHPVRHRAPHQGPPPRGARGGAPAREPARGREAAPVARCHARSRNAEVQARPGARLRRRPVAAPDGIPRAWRGRDDQQRHRERDPALRDGPKELWLFSDTQAGARASANLYSLLMSANATGLEPFGYLRHLFEQLLKAMDLGDFEALLPWKVVRTQVLYIAMGTWRRARLP